MLITHRGRAAARCDAVVVLDGGKVVERGTHEELCRGDGIYAAFAEEQQIASEVDRGGRRRGRCRSERLRWITRLTAPVVTS